MKRFKLFIPLIGFLAISAMLYGGLGKDPNDLPSVLIGRVVPKFSLPDMENLGEIITESSLPNEPYLLNVWGTWCPSCRQEHPYLNRLAEMGVPIYGINWKDEAEPAKTLLKRLGNPYVKNIFDESGDLVLSLGVTGAPETFLVDKNGIIRYHRIGVITDSLWASEMAPIFFED